MCVCVALFVRMIPIRALRMCKTSSRQWGRKTCCCPKKRILVLWISGCLGQRHQQWSSYQSVSALRTRDKHLATCKKRISSPTRAHFFWQKSFKRVIFKDKFASFLLVISWKMIPEESLQCRSKSFLKIKRLHVVMDWYILVGLANIPRVDSPMIISHSFCFRRFFCRFKALEVHQTDVQKTCMFAMIRSQIQNGCRFVVLVLSLTASSELKHEKSLEALVYSIYL